MKRIYVLLISALMVRCAFAQSEPLYDHPAPITPAVSNIFRYGDTETALFSGKINYTVPIYSLTDPDFDLDISVSYTSDGFKPRKHSGRVGYNWSLNAGGCIYREIRGVADEVYDQTPNKVGMYTCLSVGAIPDKDAVFDFSSPFLNQSEATKYFQVGGMMVDYQPDIFHFDFCGYHGAFMLNNNGEFVSVQGDAVKIKVESFVTHQNNNMSSSPMPTELQKIILTTQDGYQYVFGGQREALEYTISFSGVAGNLSQPMPPVNAWYLTRITAPNKRKIDFYYKDQTSAINSNLWVYDESYDMYHPTDPEAMPFPIASSSRLQHSRIRDVVLDSIVVRGTSPLKITFFNHVATRRLYQHSHYSSAPKNNYQLDSILVSTGNRRLKSARLGYVYRTAQGGCFHWRFLSSIYVSGVGQYGFTYPTGTYPTLDMSGENYWSEADFYGYSQQQSLKGLLSSVSFPTGGWQTFDYEPHSYGERRHFKTTDDINGSLVTESVAGSVTRPGARVKAVHTYDSNGTLIETKSFTYQEENGTSSGVFYDYAMLDIGNNLGLVYSGRGYSFLNSHIGYSRVTETTSTPNGTLYRVVSEYATGPSSYQMSSDDNLNYIRNHDPLEINSISGHTHSCMDFLRLGLFSYFTRPSSIGRLLSEKIYLGNELQRETIYTYNDIPLNTEQFMVQPRFSTYDTEEFVIFVNAIDCYASKRFYIAPDVLRQKTIRDYTTGHLHMAVEDYKHDYLKRLKESTVRYDYSKYFFTSYSYPDEYDVRYSDYMAAKGLYMLTQTGRIGKPVEICSGYIDSEGNKFITSGRIELYKNSQPEALPLLLSLGDDRSDLYSPYVYHYSTLLLKVSAPISDYTQMARINGGLNYDSRYYVACGYLYNINQRLERLSPQGKAETRYVWNGEYLQSETTGSMTTSYTYLPYVGISSKTDPRGNTVYYNYDSDGRLAEIYRINNGSKEILEAYEYHIATEE